MIRGLRFLTIILILTAACLLALTVSAQTDEAVYDIPLVACTGDTGVHAYVASAHYDRPLVALTGEFGSGSTVEEPLTIVRTGPLIVGDPNLSALRIVGDFTGSHDVNLFAANAELLDMARSRRYFGRRAINDLFANFYGPDSQFRAAYEEPQLIIAPSENLIICESTFHGAILRQEGLGSEMVDIEVPMTMVFELENGQIVRERWYYDTNLMFGLGE
jgi:hypothetical protein